MNNEELFVALVFYSSLYSFSCFFELIFLHIHRLYIIKIELL